MFGYESILTSEFNQEIREQEENRTLFGDEQRNFIKTPIDANSYIISHPPSELLLSLYGKEEIPIEMRNLVSHDSRIGQRNVDLLLMPDSWDYKQLPCCLEWHNKIKVHESTKVRYIELRIGWGEWNTEWRKLTSSNFGRLYPVFLKTKITKKNGENEISFEKPLFNGKFELITQTEKNQLDQDYLTTPIFDSIKPTLKSFEKMENANNNYFPQDHFSIIEEQEQIIDENEGNRESIPIAVADAIKSTKGVSDLPSVSNTVMETATQQASMNGPSKFMEFIKNNPETTGLIGVVAAGAVVYYSGMGGKIWRWLKGDKEAVNSYLNLNAATKKTLKSQSQDAILNCILSPDKTTHLRKLLEIEGKRRAFTSHKRILSYIDACRIDGDYKSLMLILQTFGSNIKKDQELTKQVAMLLVHNLFPSIILRQIMPRIQEIGYEDLIYNKALNELNPEMFIEYLGVILEGGKGKGKEFRTREARNLDNVLYDLEELGKIEHFTMTKFLKAITIPEKVSEFHEIKNIKSDHLLILEKCIISANEFFGGISSNKNVSRIWSFLLDPQTGIINHEIFSTIDQNQIPNIIEIKNQIINERKMIEKELELEKQVKNREKNSSFRSFIPPTISKSSHSQFQSRSLNDKRVMMITS